LLVVVRQYGLTISIEVFCVLGREGVSSISWWAAAPRWLGDMNLLYGEKIE